jgi:hypothetical protein
MAYECQETSFDILRKAQIELELLKEEKTVAQITYKYKVHLNLSVHERASTGQRVERFFRGSLLFVTYLVIRDYRLMPLQYLLFRFAKF